MSIATAEYTNVEEEAADFTAEWLTPSFEREGDSDTWRAPTIDNVSDETMTPKKSATKSTKATETNIPPAKMVLPVRNRIQRRIDWTETMLQQWECIVISIDDDCVSCEIHDLTNERNPMEYAEVYLEEFADFDRKILQEGTVFYWSIGYERHRTGQVKRFSTINVRRMPHLTRSQIKEITSKAAEVSATLIAQ